jgi:hypothetical protein
MPKRELNERERFIKGFCGHVRFLDVAEAIRPRELGRTFFALELVEELSSTPHPVSQSEVHTQLNSLEALGMVEKLPPERGVFRVDYVRTDSPAWEIVEVAVKVTTQLFPAEPATPQR